MYKYKLATYCSLCFLFIICSVNTFGQTDSGRTITDTALSKDLVVNMKDLNNLKNDQVYKINYWLSGGFSLIATAANIYAIPTIIHGKKDLTEQEFQSLDPNKYSSFNHWALEQDASKRDAAYKLTDAMLPATIVSAAFLALDDKIRKDWVKVYMMYYEMHAITFALYDFSPLGPAFQNHYRPFVYYNQFSKSERMAGNNKNSMYSGHVASATAATFFMVKVYSDYHPSIGGNKYLLYGLASLPPLALGYYRIKALAHFPTDVLTGFAVGAVCGIVVPELHRIKKKNIDLGVSYSGYGPQFSFKWKPGETTIKQLPTFK